MTRTVLSVVAAVLLTGCGTSAHDRYVTQADAICGHLVARLSVDEHAHDLSGAQRDEADAARRLGTLRAPAADAGAARALGAAVRSGLESLRATNAIGFAAALSRVKTQATTLGLKSCV